MFVFSFTVQYLVYFLFFAIISLGKNVSIYHECEGRIEKSVPRIAIWHHEACRVMTNGDPKGLIFLSYPHTNNGSFFFFFFLDKIVYTSVKSQISLSGVHEKEDRTAFLMPCDF